jgi:exonuclease SbcD
MRILHTSDWHLGRRLESFSRDEEHERFLDWLLKVVDEHDVDALLVAGDVYQNDVPPASAETLYFRFLSEFSKRFPERGIVLIAGNHDSGARLQAPAPVLETLNVHVQGTYNGLDDDALYRVLYHRDGTPGAVVAAIPYISDRRLFQVAVDTSADDYRERRNSEFRTLYRDAAHRARELHPDLPVVVMGHLATGEAKESDYETGLHRIGTLGALPKDLTDDADYAALGHIHRCFPVGKAGYYSGSPIPLRLNELSTRYVLVVDVHAGAPAQVKRVEVPTFRRVLRLKPAPLDGILEQVKQLVATPEDELETWVACEIITPVPLAGAHDRIADALPSRTVLVQAREVAQAPTSDDDNTDARNDAPPSLHHMTPADLFARIWTAHRGEAPDDRVRAAFDELVLDAQRTAGDPA